MAKDLSHREFVEKLRRNMQEFPSFPEHLQDLFEKDIEEACDRLEKLEAELATEKADREIEKTVDSEAILGLRAENEQQQAELAKHRWIPVNERLPKTKNYILVTNTKNKMTTVWYWDNSNIQARDLKQYYTHWRPIILPKAEELLKE